MKVLNLIRIFTVLALTVSFSNVFSIEGILKNCKFKTPKNEIVNDIDSKSYTLKFTCEARSGEKYTRKWKVSKAMFSGPDGAKKISSNEKTPLSKLNKKCAINIRKNLWKKIHENLNNFAGKKLILSKRTYDSESKTNQHNKALAYLLKSYNRFYSNVEDAVDAYTKQGSVMVTSEDIAVMASVFANNGIHPITRGASALSGASR